MPQTALQFPAVMVLREEGAIVYLDRRAREFTGFRDGEALHLRDLMARVFPERRDHAEALRMFRRAAATAGRLGAARFQVEFPPRGNGRPRRTTVQVQRWGSGPEDRSYLVSFLPSEPRLSQLGVDRAGILHGVARRVVRLLDSAAACSRAVAAEADPADDRIAILSALIERAQGLLGSLEAQAQGRPLGEAEGRE